MPRAKYTPMLILIQGRYGSIWTGQQIIQAGVSINLDEALDVFDKALAATPTDIEADDIASTMYYILIRQGMYEEALRACEKVIEKNPRAPCVWYLKTRRSRLSVVILKPALLMHTARNSDINQFALSNLAKWRRRIRAA